MKYKDLPNQDAILRLTSYAFVRAGADESVFKFYRSIAPALEFFSNQRAKIVSKHGIKDGSGSYTISAENKESFIAEITALTESDVPFVISDLDLLETDFDQDQCRKPSDISLLLSSSEKEAILRIAGIIQAERRIEKLQAVQSELEAATVP